MQIHEITQRRVNEGLMDFAKSVGNKGMALANYYAGDYAKSAEYSQKELQRQGRNPAAEVDPKTAWKIKYDNLEKTPGMTTYITGLAQEWLKSPNATPAPRANPGQMSSTVAASKPGQDMQKMFGQPKGGIQDMQSDLQERAPIDPNKLSQIKNRARGITTTKTTTAPTAPTAPAAPAPTDYAGKFKEWSDEKLATKVDGVYGQFATMDEVRKISGLDAKLSAALQQVDNTQGTPQHTASIQEYLKLASAGIQAIGQEKRFTAQQQRHKPGAESSATNQLGLTDRQLQSLKTLAQTPAGKSQILKDLGIV
jgi:hypothetical protein